MAGNITASAKNFFNKLHSSTEGLAELKRLDTVVQFNLRDGDPFYVQVKKGKIAVKEGNGPGEAALHFLSDTQTLLNLFQGKVKYSDMFTGYGPMELRKLTATDLQCGWGGPMASFIGKLFRIGQETP